MTRAVLLLTAAMAAASLATAAQQNQAGSNPGLQNNSDNSAQRTVTIAGCLNSSGPGIYTLSNSQGATFTLAGNTDTLQGHVGQEVEVTGQQGFSSNASVGTSKPSSTIDVTKTRFIADHCNSGGAGTGKDSSGHEPHLKNVAQTGGDLSNGQLPQTSTILPLLGLIGLGSLVAGFFARR
jgi:hypothetical protein